MANTKKRRQPAPGIQPPRREPPLESTPPSESPRLTQVVDAIVRTAEGKGWKAELVGRDDKTQRYASIEVSRSNADFGKTEATVEISIEGNGVRFPVQPVSLFRTTGLADLSKSLAAAIEELPWIKKSKPAAQPKAALNELINVLRRFHSVARQLRKRHSERPTLDVSDEYDVQDLLHALLRTLFDDVRAEEAVPSYAGAASRMDFLLKNEKVAVEAKMTRPTLRDKQIGEELIVDIARYRGHPDCNALVCFVYDPQGYIANPSGLENDLSGQKDGVNVRLVVCPRN
jgi:hypothetical protein